MNQAQKVAAVRLLPESAHCLGRKCVEHNVRQIMLANGEEDGAAGGLCADCKSNLYVQVAVGRLLQTYKLCSRFRAKDMPNFS